MANPFAVLLEPLKVFIYLLNTVVKNNRLHSCYLSLIRGLALSQGGSLYDITEISHIPLYIDVVPIRI